MYDNSDKNFSSDYFDDYFKEAEAESRRKIRRNKSWNGGNRNGRGRKGLKWKLKGLFSKKNRKSTGIVLAASAVLIIVIIIISSVGGVQTTETAATIPETTADLSSYHITGVPVMSQDEYRACCETYACTMLLQYLDFDIDVPEFVNNYLTIKPVSYGDDGNLYGPDMNSAFAGDINEGYGINAPGMAKCMNKYLDEKGSKLTAYPLSGESLEDLCREYVINDIPVMVWSTAYLQEPYVKASWIVNYVDENASHEIGDTVDWQMHEHCMVLIGYDKENYYLSDSVAGEVSAFEKEAFEERYKQIGTQAIVVK